MTRCILAIEYLGKNYKGSQKQIHKNTIQDEIEKALCTLIKEKISTVFSGRTDTGVSAREQILHFDLSELKAKEFLKNKKKFLHSINSILPDDIKVLKFEAADDDFHAQKHARFKHYQYKIKNSDTKGVFDIATFWYRPKLNAERMNEAIKYLIGKHDFSAFKSTSDNPAKVCEIYFARVKKKDDYIIIDIVGNRFLYNMVRTIVGTLFEIEKDALAPQFMQEVLELKDRKKAGMTIQSEGLTLIKVGYEDCSKYTEKLNKLNDKER